MRYFFCTRLGLGGPPLRSSMKTTSATAFAFTFTLFNYDVLVLSSMKTTSATKLKNILAGKLLLVLVLSSMKTTSATYSKPLKRWRNCCPSPIFNENYLSNPSPASEFVDFQWSPSPIFNENYLSNGSDQRLSIVSYQVLVLSSMKTTSATLQEK